MITVKFTLVTRARGIYGNAVESKEAEDDALCVVRVTAPLGLQREEAEDDALQVQYTSTQVHKYTLKSQFPSEFTTARHYMREVTRCSLLRVVTARDEAPRNMTKKGWFL